jgi:GcrA cell cycle regulator
MSWNDERVELLKKLWAEGLSASQIAGRIGAVTRNAVIGKVHRLGLSGRATTTRMKSHRPRVRANIAKRPVVAKPRFANVGNTALRALYQDSEPYVPPAEELVIPLAERRSIQTLEESHCRWPIGDPQEAEFHFCGKGKVNGLPYCEFHARRAFQPPQARRSGGPGATPVRYRVETAPAISAGETPTAPAAPEKEPAGA